MIFSPLTLFPELVEVLDWQDWLVLWCRVCGKKRPWIPIITHEYPNQLKVRINMSQRGLKSTALRQYFPTSLNISPREVGHAEHLLLSWISFSTDINKDCIVVYILCIIRGYRAHLNWLDISARIVYNKISVTNIFHISFKKLKKRLDKSLTILYTLYVDSVR